MNDIKTGDMVYVTEPTEEHLRYLPADQLFFVVALNKRLNAAVLSPLDKPSNYVNYPLGILRLAHTAKASQGLQMTMYHKGLKQYRFKDNPEERRFAEAWEKQNNPADFNADSTLAWLLAPDSRKESVSDRDREVAATTIQWLGSPVGQVFLRDLGYERSQEERGDLLMRDKTPPLDVHEDVKTPLTSRENLKPGDAIPVPASVGDFFDK